jgi:hypothetical protein
MAKFNLDYYSGENFYSDGDIEKEILKIVKTQGSYGECSVSGTLPSFQSPREHPELVSVSGGCDLSGDWFRLRGD